MSDEGPREVVDGVAQVAVTAANSSGIGLRQMLLTVLAPTLALVGIAIGVWDSSRREDSARKRDEDLRTSALVLPYYDSVIAAQDVLDLSIQECDDDYDDYLYADIGSPEEEEAVVAFTKSCERVSSNFDELDTALNRAMLVSNRDLEPVVIEYKTAQSDFESIYFDASSVESDCFEESGAPVFEDMNEQVGCVEAAQDKDLKRRQEAEEKLKNVRARLTNVVQAQVLLDRAQSSSTENP